MASPNFKVPPKGTRGVPFPHFMARFGNRWVLRQFRGGGARTQGGVPALLLETHGAKSGKPRKAVLGYVDEGPGSRLIIASLAGSARNPSWLYNLAKRPEATIELPDGSRPRVSATSLTGAELEAAWKLVAQKAPEYAKYLAVTDRQMPIVRLRDARAAESG